MIQGDNGRKLDIDLLKGKKQNKKTSVILYQKEKKLHMLVLGSQWSEEIRKGQVTMNLGLCWPLTSKDILLKTINIYLRPKMDLVCLHFWEWNWKTWIPNGSRSSCTWKAVAASTKEAWQTQGKWDAHTAEENLPWSGRSRGWALAGRKCAVLGPPPAA